MTAPTPTFTALAVLDCLPRGPNPPDPPNLADLAVPEDRRLFALHLERPLDPAAGAPIWHGWQPGQFAMIRPGRPGRPGRPDERAPDLVWARPLSICQATETSLIFLFQLAGRGTRRLADLRRGDTVSVWGPLGAGFTVEPDAPTLLLAGGIGLAPFLGYADAHPNPRNLLLMFAHRLPSDHYPLDRLNPMVRLEDRPEHAAADREAFLADTARAIRDTAASSGLVLACGPAPFLRHVREHALAAGAHAQISLENRMGCGVGACLGCVAMPAARGAPDAALALPLRTCVDGPVFWADQVEVD
jgi:dihydroorotate dehydrogenase electron transfer subunit